MGVFAGRKGKEEMLQLHYNLKKLKKITKHFSK